MSALVESFTHISKVISDHWWIGNIFVDLIIYIHVKSVKELV